MASSPPSVLLIVADDHQHDALGVAGHPVVRTPALDALARRGARFERAYTMGGLLPAVCSPARACLLTGAQVFRADANPRLGETGNEIATLAPGLATLPELFRRAGYDTFLSGKWHNDPSSLRRSFDRGRRIFLGGMCDHRRVPLHDYTADRPLAADPYYEPGFSTELFCEAVKDFLRTRTSAQPFFAYLALTSPHDPCTPPARFAASYPPAEIPLPPGFAALPAFDNGELQIRDERLQPKPLDPDALRLRLAAYYGMISHHDEQLGRVFATLEATGQAENTLVVYLSDHGLSLGRHGLLGKQNLYEHSVRVPLILAGPGVPQNRAHGQLVYSLDLFATLCGLSGVPCPPGLDSRDLRPLLADPAARIRDSVSALYKQHQRMTCADDWKLIEYHVNGARTTELFHLATDPAEECNRAAEPGQAARVAALRRQLGRWQREIGDRWWQPALDAGPPGETARA